MWVKTRRNKTAVSAYLSLIGVVVLLFGSVNALAVIPYVTERVNLELDGGEMTGTRIGEQRAQISQDGRYVAFVTISDQIVASDTNTAYDVFVRDLKLGITTRASVSNTGGQLSQASSLGGLSGNGRYVTFRTSDSNVVSGDTNTDADVFVRDLINQTTERISVSSSGAEGNAASSGGILSADGRYSVFSSQASNLTPNDTNGKSDVFVRDRKLNTTTLLSKNSSGSSANNNSYVSGVSCDGAYITFTSGATDLVTSDINGNDDIFLVDRINSNSITNITAGANNYANSPSAIACNGSTVLYLSPASNLVLNDTNGTYDIFAYDIGTGLTQRVNVDSSGNQTTYVTTASTQYPGGVDFSGRYVVFSGVWDDLVTGDINGRSDVFIRDLQEGTTEIISKRNSTTQTTQDSSTPSISLDGSAVVYMSSDDGLVTGDTNDFIDIFVSRTGI